MKKKTYPIADQVFNPSTSQPFNHTRPALFTMKNYFDLILKKLEDWLSGFFRILPNLVLAVLVFVTFFIAARYIRKISYRIIHRMKKNIDQWSLVQHSLFFNSIHWFIHCPWPSPFGKNNFFATYRSGDCRARPWICFPGSDGQFYLRRFYNPAKTI